MSASVQPIVMSPVGRQLDDYSRGDKASLLQLLNDLRNNIVYAQLQSAWNVQTMFGADASGGKDATAAIQRAHDALPAGGGVLYLPPGTYKVGGAISLTKQCTLRGAGINVTTISKPSATFDLITLNGAFQRVCDLSIVAAVPQTAGSYLNYGGSASRQMVDHVYLDGWFRGIQWAGIASLWVERCYLLNGHPVDGVGVSIFGATSADIAFDQITIDNAAGSQPAAGFLVTQCQDVLIQKCSVLHCDSGLSVLPAAAQVVASLWVDNSKFDNCFTRGIQYVPGAGGSVLRSRISNCWTASTAAAAGIGLLLSGGGGGTLDGVDVSDHQSFLNASDGLQIIQPAINVKIDGGMFAANGRDGIRAGTAGSSPTDFEITRVRSGNVAGFAGNTGWGVNVTNAAAANYTLALLDTRGNTAGGLQDLGAGAKQVGLNR